MKRIIAILLAMVMVISLAACGKEEKAEKYCSSCGEGITSSAAFCEHCGAATGDTKTESVSTPSNSSPTLESTESTPNASKGLSIVKLPSGGLTVAGRGTCTDTDIIIPSMVNSERVLSISDGAFNDDDSLTSITIPDSVTNIGLAAFRGCSSLNSITIPNSITYIDNFTFEGCTSLTIIKIPDGVTSFGKGAFEGCTSLESINIPDGVMEVGEDAFSGCTNLKNVYFDSEKQQNRFAECFNSNVRFVVLP